MTAFLTRFRADRRGATAIEYAIMASGIAAVIITTVYSIGGKVGAYFTSVEAGF